MDLCMLITMLIGYGISGTLLGVGIWQEIEMLNAYSGSVNTKITKTDIQMTGQCLNTYTFQVNNLTYAGSYINKCFTGGFVGMKINVRYIPANPSKNYVTHFSSSATTAWPITMIVLGGILLLILIVITIAGIVGSVRGKKKEVTDPKMDSVV